MFRIKNPLANEDLPCDRRQCWIGWYEEIAVFEIVDIVTGKSVSKPLYSYRRAVMLRNNKNHEYGSKRFIVKTIKAAQQK